MKYVEVPSQMHKEWPLHDLGPGLPGFNNSRILCFKKNINSTPSKTQTGPSTMSNALPITPPPPYSNKGRGCGLATAQRSPSKGPTSMLKRSMCSHAAGMDDPFTVVPGPGSSRTGSAYTSSSTSQFTIPDLPLPSSPTASSTSQFTIPHLPLPSSPTAPPSTVGNITCGIGHCYA
ncbi:hypothetical protein K439DRAFT_1622733 [Ramaria rubella]|nr:hypothetical protein K439DRAFT_1622733 [Ramaria rubella]